MQVVSVTAGVGGSGGETDDGVRAGGADVVVAVRQTKRRAGAVAVRDCAGGDVRGFGAGERSATSRAGFAGLCGWGAGGRRAACGDLRNGRGSNFSAS